MSTPDVDSKHYNFLHTLVAGGVPAIFMDTVLFPIDTIKTRLQSERGFWRSGGFRGIYQGLAPAAAGSGPIGAIYFSVYEGSKHYLSAATHTQNSTLVQMVSVSFAEVLACLVRVPVEIAKQRRQALGNIKNNTARQILWSAYRTEGIRRGLYRGYVPTIMRDMPYGMLYLPLWEYFKLQWTPFTGLEATPLTAALCGACAGGISAALTTPLDVAQTRVMLAKTGTAKNKLGMVSTLNMVYKERGVRGLFAGVVPRVLWVTTAGALFFGLYDLTTNLLSFNDEAAVSISNI